MVYIARKTAFCKFNAYRIDMFFFGVILVPKRDSRDIGVIAGPKENYVTSSACHHFDRPGHLRMAAYFIFRTCPAHGEFVRDFRRGRAHGECDGAPWNAVRAICLFLAGHGSCHHRELRACRHRPGKWPPVPGGQARPADSGGGCDSGRSGRAAWLREKKNASGDRRYQTDYDTQDGIACHSWLLPPPR